MTYLDSLIQMHPEANDKYIMGIVKEFCPYEIVPITGGPFAFKSPEDCHSCLRCWAREITEGGDDGDISGILSQHAPGGKR